MRTTRSRGTLLARLERLEYRAQALSTIKIRYGNLRRLPDDYKGERHVVVAKELPSKSGQEWVEFEEVPGPSPNPPAESSGGLCRRIDVMFVDTRDAVMNATPDSAYVERWE